MEGIDNMDAIKVYEEYFLRKKKVIKDVIRYYKNQQKTIALWGAGKKGIAFLKAIDPKDNLVDYVYDKDENKYGTVIETGHIIEDYKQKPADVVFVANSMYELEIIHMLQDVGHLEKVINLDNIVLGDLQLEDIVDNEHIDLSRVRGARICAVVILYNPNMDVVDNIKSYAQEVECVYLYDNSESINERVICELKNFSNIQYIQKNQNIGLPVAFNEVAEIALGQGYDWMITFDQDSVAKAGMVDAMREYVNSIMCDEKIAIVAPVTNEIDYNTQAQERYITYFDKVIQSGAMHDLKIMKKIGGYDEGLFIDWVDYEYCARCIVKGYKIVKLNNAILMHNQQDDVTIKRFENGKTYKLNKYSADRYYYIYRNTLYCYERYKEEYPLFALECENCYEFTRMNAQKDSNRAEVQRAFKQAYADFKKGKMGKRERL